MKHKRWQALVMVAFAWVLWRETAVNRLEKDLEIIDGYESKAKCTDARTQTVNRQIKSMKKLSKRLSQNNPPKLLVSPKGLSMGMSFIGGTKKEVKRATSMYYCLPSDFDPRPRSKK